MKEVLKLETQDLISKKELLEMTGISYGQLYRWKRKALIPENWFIRRSTYTGQETFFPRAQVLDRIEKIQGLKSDRSLDELADMFSPQPTSASLTREDTACLVSEAALEVYEEKSGRSEVYQYQALFEMYLLDQALDSGKVSLAEAELMVECFRAHSTITSEEAMKLWMFRKRGSGFCMLTKSGQRIFYDPEAHLAFELDLAVLNEELKSKYQSINGGDIHAEK